MSAISGPTLWSRFISVVGVVDKSVNYALGEWGALVAQRPILTMSTSFVVSLGLLAGLALIADNVEGASEKLWCAFASRRELCIHMFGWRHHLATIHPISYVTGRRKLPNN
jgi:hypothetical protein